MRVRYLLLCLPMLCLTGCSWLPFAIDNLTGSTTGVFAEYKFKQQCKQLAELAWETTCQEPAHRLKHRSSEYEIGFKAGFIDYLDCNGNGEPPGTLPRHLRRPILRNAEQQQEIFDWIAGFRHGASVAAQENWRSRIVVPVPLPPYRRDEPFEQIVPRYGTGSPARGGLPATATFEPSGPTDADAPNPTPTPALPLTPLDMPRLNPPAMPQQPAARPIVNEGTSGIAVFE